MPKTKDAPVKKADRIEPDREYEIWFGLKEDVKREFLDCGLHFTKETEEVRTQKGKMKSVRIPKLGHVAKVTGDRIKACLDRLAKTAIEKVGGRDVVRTLADSPKALKRGARTLSEVCYLVPNDPVIRRDRTPDPVSVTGLPVFE